jgi:hypothetical protein
VVRSEQKKLSDEICARFDSGSKIEPKPELAEELLDMSMISTLPLPQSSAKPPIQPNHISRNRHSS